MGTRINKYLSEIGYCSRRSADKLLEEGRITINGKKPQLGEKVEEGDIVAVNGRVVSKRSAKHVYIALNKPRGRELNGTISSFVPTYVSLLRFASQYIWSFPVVL